METISSKLAMILGPIGKSDFFESYWEQQPLHVSRSSREHFASLLSVENIESMLSTQALYFPSVQLTQSQKPVEIAEYTDESRRLLPHRLIERHHGGATIVISQAHEKLASLAHFRREVQRELNMRCQTNVYLSPKGQRGFNAHYDSHDVFILQVDGTKTFNFYEGGIELPYQHDDFQADKHTVGKLSQSIELEPGDTLYIPRGVLHDAVATEQTSLHITLGVYAITLRDVLAEMTQQLTDKDINFRKSVPQNILSSERNDDDPALDALKDCLSPKFTHEQLTRALSGIQDESVLDSAPDCTGMLKSVFYESVKTASYDEKSSSSSQSFFVEQAYIQLDLSCLTSIDRTDELIRLRTHGQVLEFSLPFFSSIERILAGEKLNMLTVENLNLAQKKSLYTRLLYANLLLLEDH